MTDKTDNPFPPMPGDPVEVSEPSDPDEAVVVEAPAEEETPKSKRKS